MNNTLGLYLFCALCFAIAAGASYMEYLFEKAYKQPRNDTKPLHPIERPKPNKAA